MKRTTILLLVLTLWGTCASLRAARVTLQQAQQCAAQFMSPMARMSRGATTTSAAAAELSMAGANGSYYVFNNPDGGGFVIVSGSDLTEQVLGFSDEGTFDASNMPVNLAQMLDDYAEQIELLEAGKAKPARQAQHRIVGRKSVRALLKTRWDQADPYNQKCPSGSLTGCTATALAQVLKFYEHPMAVIHDIPYHGNYSSVYAGTVIDWKNMLNTYQYHGSESQASKDAVAELMRICGQSMLMEWSANGSSATDAFFPIVLNRFFGYDYGARQVYRDHYPTADDWNDLIFNEVVHGRPVIYSGQSKSGLGHSFVVDGYFGDNYFHVNWGWNGLSDGNYLLSVVTPAESGYGGAANGQGYTERQNAIIGIKPATEDLRPMIMTISELAPYDSGSNSLLQSYTATRSTNGSFTIPGYFFYAQRSNQYESHVDFNIGLYKDGEMQKLLLVGDKVKEYFYNRAMSGFVKNGNSWTIDGAGAKLEFSFDSSLPDGTYELHALSREAGTEKWYICHGDDLHYCTLTISGNKAVMAMGEYMLAEDNSPLFIEDYAITVGGIAVTSDNAAAITGQGITGTVAYNPDTRTLMLNNATIATVGGIPAIDIKETGEAVTIQLAGRNIIQTDNESLNALIGKRAFTITGSGTLETTGSMLLLSQLTVDGADITVNGFVSSISPIELKGGSEIVFPKGWKYLSNGIVDCDDRQCTQVVISARKPAERYGIFVLGQEVTADNSEAITGEGISGSVSFDPATWTLTLNNASITGDAAESIRREVTNYGVFRQQTLTIRLEGENKTSTTGFSDLNLRGSTVVEGTGSLDCKAVFVGRMGGGDQDGVKNLLFDIKADINASLILLTQGYTCTITDCTVDANIIGDNDKQGSGHLIIDGGTLKSHSIENINALTVKGESQVLKPQGGHYDTGKLIFADAEGNKSTDIYIHKLTEEEMGIETVNAESASHARIYNIGGQLTNRLSRGINIIRHSDGKTRKIRR